MNYLRTLNVQLKHIVINLSDTTSVTLIYEANNALSY